MKLIDLLILNGKAKGLPEDLTNVFEIAKELSGGWKNELRCISACIIGCFLGYFEGYSEGWYFLSPKGLKKKGILEGKKIQRF